MSLRTKFATVLLALLILPTVTTTAVEIDRTLSVIVDDLGDSAALLVNQTFEQMRAMGGSGQDPLSAVSRNPSLQAFVKSSQTLSKGIVYLRIKRLDGTIILGVPPSSPAERGSVLPFSSLQAMRAEWWPSSLIRALWTPHTYETSQTVAVNNDRFATISVGISTSRMAPRVHRALTGILVASASAMALSLFGAMFFVSLILRPLAVITSNVERLAAGGDSMALEVGGSDELSILADKFNQFSRRINSTRAKWEAERGQLLKVSGSVTDAVLLIDSGGKILFANSEAQGRLGLPAGGLAEGRSLDSLLGKDNPLVRIINTAHALGTAVYDVPLDLSDRTTSAHFAASIFLLGKAPVDTGLLAILRDLEPLRELENVVGESDHLFPLSGLITEVTRQIRQPLDAINSQLNLLGGDFNQGRSSEERVNALRIELERLDKAVEALNPFLKPQVNKSEQSE
jgi:PAS domain-containing protein